MKPREAVDRLLTLGDLSTPEAQEVFIDAFIDPDEYTAEMLAQLDRLRAVAGEARRESGLVSLEQEVIPGDLHIDGDLDIHGHVLVVGDLVVTGYLMSWVHCCVVVLGDVRAGAISATRSYWAVGGAIESPVVWLGTYGLALHRGALKARLYVEEDYNERLEGCGPLEAAEVVATDALSDEPDTVAKLESLLRPEVLRDDEGDIDAWQVMRAASRGDPLFR